mgnify:CR=1 FL=1
MIEIGLYNLNFLTKIINHTNLMVGYFTELLCAKDSDWSHQDEWRLIGNAGSKAIKFEIDNIYLGFDVSDDNENKIIDLSRKYGFGVYKMNKPNVCKTTTYNKINN